MHVFGAYPLGGREEIGRGLVRCGKCAKVTMEASFGEHQREPMSLSRCLSI